MRYLEGEEGGERDRAEKEEREGGEWEWGCEEEGGRDRLG